MHGKRYLLDTNAIIALLQGNHALHYQATLISADKRLHKIDKASVWDFS